MNPLSFERLCLEKSVEAILSDTPSAIIRAGKGTIMNPDYNWPEKLREATVFTERSIQFALQQRDHWDGELEKLFLLLGNQKHWLEEAEKREAEKGTNK